MLQTYRQTDIRHHISLVNFVLKSFIIVKTLEKMVFKSIFTALTEALYLRNVTFSLTLSISQADF